MRTARHRRSSPHEPRAGTGAVTGAVLRGAAAGAPGGRRPGRDEGGRKEPKSLYSYVPLPGPAALRTPGTGMPENGRPDDRRRIPCCLHPAAPPVPCSTAAPAVRRPGRRKACELARFGGLPRRGPRTLLPRPRGRPVAAADRAGPLGVPPLSRGGGLRRVGVAQRGVRRDVGRDDPGGTPRAAARAGRPEQPCLRWARPPLAGPARGGGSGPPGAPASSAPTAPHRSDAETMQVAAQRYDSASWMSRIASCDRQRGVLGSARPRSGPGPPSRNRSLPYEEQSP